MSSRYVIIACVKRELSGCIKTIECLQEGMSNGITAAKILSSGRTCAHAGSCFSNKGANKIISIPFLQCEIYHKGAEGWFFESTVSLVLRENLLQRLNMERSLLENMSLTQALSRDVISAVLFRSWSRLLQINFEKILK